MGRGRGRGRGGREKKMNLSNLIDRRLTSLFYIHIVDTHIILF